MSFIMKQPRRLCIGDTGFNTVDGRVNVAVRHQQIEHAVEVNVEKETAETEPQAQAEAQEKESEASEDKSTDDSESEAEEK